MGGILINAMYKKRLFSVIIHVTAIILLLLAAYFIPTMLYDVKADTDGRLRDLTDAEALKDRLVADLIRGEQDNKELFYRLSEYNGTCINKDIFLTGLVSFANLNGVSVTRFSEAMNEHVKSPGNLVIESLPEQGIPSFIHNTFNVTLHGNNNALLKTVQDIRELSSIHRITNIFFASDKIINVLPKISSNSSLLEILADTRRLETFKQDNVDYAVTSSLSFTIEFFCLDSMSEWSVFEE